MSFNRANGLGWAYGQKFTSVQANALDIDHANAVDGAGGGPYAPALPITVNGSGIGGTFNAATVNGVLTNTGIGRVRRRAIQLAGTFDASVTPDYAEDYNCLAQTGDRIYSLSGGSAGDSVRFYKQVADAYKTTIAWAGGGATLPPGATGYIELFNDGIYPWVGGAWASFYAQQPYRTILGANADTTYTIASADLIIIPNTISANRVYTIDFSVMVNGSRIKFYAISVAGFYVQLQDQALSTIVNMDGNTVGRRRMIEFVKYSGLGGLGYQRIDELIN